MAKTKKTAVPVETAAPVVMLTKAAILSAVDRPSEIVAVPEWGGSVRVMSMTGTARDEWELGMISDEGKIERQDNGRARLISKCVVDESGDLMFNEDEIVALGNKSAAALDRIFSKCQALSGIGVADVDNMEKNS